MDMQSSTSTSLPTPLVSHMPTTMTLDQCIKAWLTAKTGKSGSQKTATAYADGLTEFRSLLQSVGHDLDSQPSIIAPLLQGWCAFCKREGEEVAPATYNQRLAILSSFYRYAMTHEVVGHNPASRVERRTDIKQHAARPIAPQAVQKGLHAIDRSTLEGKRDYAILSLALATGRRVQELANLRYGHIQRQGGTTHVLWPKCKGGKSMTDILQEKTTKALYDYLSALYGQELYTMSKEAPVWVSFSDRCQGQALSTRTLQRICEKYLGTSKMHATRHTFAVTMHHSGASLAEIGKGLGHSNLKTTSDYLEEHLGYENKYAATIESIFGI